MNFCIFFNFPYFPHFILFEISYKMEKKIAFNMNINLNPKMGWGLLIAFIMIIW